MLHRCFTPGSFFWPTFLASLCLFFVRPDLPAQTVSGPTIVRQLVGESVEEGSTVTLRVGATGTPPVSYQWLKEGAVVAHGLRDSLVLAQVKTSAAGHYAVVVTDRNGRTISSHVRVDVRDATANAALPSLPASTGAAASPLTFSTVAGRFTAGSADGSAAAARFNGPRGLAIDASNNLYVADSGNHTIRKISASGNVTTLAGSVAVPGSLDGTGTAARFISPWGLAVDGAGSVYVADFGNSAIRKITAAGVVTTFAGVLGGSGSSDGTGSGARFFFPAAVALDSTGTHLYVADQGNNTIRRIVVATGVVTTFAGSAGQSGTADGTGGAARFHNPYHLTVDSSGNVYVADINHAAIRKISSAGVVTTLAGSATQGSVDGTGSSARFMTPSGVAVDSSGTLFVCDMSNRNIRRVTSTGVVTTLAGAFDIAGSSDGIGGAARFYLNQGGAVDSAGNYYVTDFGANTVRRITPAGVVTTFAGLAGMGSADGTGAAAQFFGPSATVLDSSGNLLIADTNNHTIRKMTPTGVVTTLAGLAGVNGTANGTGSTARFNGPISLAADAAGNVYVCDQLNSAIRKVTAAGVVTTFAGLEGVAGAVDGVGSAARFTFPNGISSDGEGNLYVSDAGNETIRRIVVATGAVTTIAGTAGQEGTTDGTGAAARLTDPRGVVADAAHGLVYFADHGAVRKISSSGVVTTVAGAVGTQGYTDGTGTAARFSGNFAGCLDLNGNILMADRWNYVLRQITPAGVVTTIAGVPFQSGSVDGTADAARFLYPAPPFVDSTGRLYVADSGNHTIRVGAAPTTGPVITSISSARQVVALGQNLTLTVTATGATSYQWKRNGLPLSGATSSSYTITGAKPVRDAGWYQVVATGAVASATSPVVFVNVSVPAEVVAWGASDRGQLNVPTGLGAVCAVSAGFGHGLALKADGTVVAWGDNTFGTTNVPVGLSGVVAIAAGNSGSLALRSDGTLIGWGSLSFSLPYTDVVALALDFNFLLLKSDGTVVALNSFGGVDAAAPSSLTNVVGIAQSGFSNVVLKADGTVVAWGSNIYGQNNVPVGLSSVAAVAVSDRGYALRHDGSVTIWGAGVEIGQTRMPSGVTGVAALAARSLGVMALMTNGTVSTWGQDVPPPSGLTNVVAVAFGDTFAVALRSNPDDVPAAITTQPTAQTAFLGTSATFSVGATGTPAPSYQWRKGGVALSGATSASYTISSVTSGSAGSYDVVVSNYLASVTSTAATLGIATTPLVAAFPAPRQVVSLGSTLSLAASVNGATSYQWKRNGFLIAGATSATYTAANATPARDNGWYQLVATNAAGSTTSPVVFVNVAVNPSQVAGWGYPYTGQTALQSSLGAVSAVAVGGFHAIALKGDGTVVGWGNNPYGETTAPVGLNNVVAIAAGYYFSVALRADGTVVAWGSNGDGQSTSPFGLSGVVAIAAGSTHALALKADGTVAAWGWNAYGQTAIPSGLSNVAAVSAGTYHSLALKADGTAVGWGNNGQGQVSGGSALTGLVMVAAGSYHNVALRSDGLVVAWGSNTSGAATVPGGLTGVIGVYAGNAHSAVLKADGTAFAWGDNTYGQTFLSPGLAGVQSLAVGGSTTLVLRNPSADTALPVVSVPPASQTAYLSGSVTFSVSLAANPAPASYQWRKGGTSIYGANNSSLALYGLQLTDAASYDVVVTNGLGSVTSAAATLSVLTPPVPVITSQPASGVLNVGNVGSFRVIVSSPVSVSYQWRKNGVANGKVGPDLILGAVSLADAGTYDVIVTSNGGSVTSAPATLVVHPFAAPAFTVQPVGGVIEAGNVAHFFATVTGAVPLTYQWRKDGVAVPGANGPTLILGNAQLADAGTYDLVATNGLGSTTSTGAVLLFPSLLTVPTVTQPPVNQSALVGLSASLSVAATGAPAPTFQWRRNGVPLPGATAATYNVSVVQENDAGAYDVVVTNQKGSVVSSSATLAVQGRPVIWTARLALGSGDAVGTFTLEGTASKRLLVRAVGPTLGTFGVSDPLADPKLEIYNTAGQLVAGNDDWSAHADQPGLIAATAAAGAFALPAGSKDAVVLRSYAPGTYFARTSAASGTGRIVLLELYDAEPASLSRVPYTAVRGSAAPSGGEIVVGGLGADGTSQRTYLLRAAGPALGSVGTLSNPTFTVLRDSVARAGNDDWQTGADTAGVAAAAERVGAFAFAEGSRDAALLVAAYVRSGHYVGQIAGAGGTSGLVLVEAIEADSARPAVYPPAVVSPPASRVSPAGTNVVLEARAAGTAPVLYQWRKDGLTLNGATFRSLALSNVFPANAGVYTVVASNIYGTATSLPAVLTVDTTVVAPIATQIVAPPGGYVAGSTLLVNCTLTYPGTATGLGWTVTLPAGWSYAGGGGAEGDVKPSLGTTGTLEWSWSTPPTGPVNFSYTLNVPPGETGIRSLGATALVRTATAVQTVTATPTPLLLVPLVALHSADTNQDFAFNLFELTRVIELYNTILGTTRTGCYSVATTAGSEDGFVGDTVRAGSVVVTLSRYHSADANKDGKFSLTELTRVIELFNTRAGTARTGTYHVQAGTEDGFAPGP